MKVKQTEFEHISYRLLKYEFSVEKNEGRFSCAALYEALELQSRFIWISDEGFSYRCEVETHLDIFRALLEEDFRLLERVLADLQHLENFP